MEARFDDDELLAEAGWLRRLALALARDEADADDLTQETLLAALRSGTKPRQGWRAWLRGTLLRRRAQQARVDIRRRRREERVAPRDDAEEAAHWLETAEAFETVLAEVRQLPPSLGAVILLRYFHDLSESEIAARQGVAVGTVRSRLHRARMQLRGRLHQRWGGAHWLSALLFVPRVPGPRTITWSAMKTSTQATIALTIAATLTTLLLLTPTDDARGWQGDGRSTGIAADATPRASARAEFDALEEAVREAAQEDWGEGDATAAEPAADVRVSPDPADLSGRGSLVLSLLDSANGRLVESGRVRVLGEGFFLDQAFLQNPLQLELPAGEHELLIQALGFEPLQLEGVQVVAREITPLGAHVLQRGTASLQGGVWMGDERLAAGRVELHGAGRQACPDCDQGDGLVSCGSCGFALDRSSQPLAADRDFLFEGLCAGDYLLVAYDAQDTVVGHQRVEIPRGKEVRADLHLRFLDLPIRIVDADGAPFRGVWFENGQPYSNPIRFLTSDRGVLTGRASWTPPGRFEQDGVTYLRETKSDPNAHILRMQLLGVRGEGSETLVEANEAVREVLLSPKLPSPLPKLHTELLSVDAVEPDGYRLLRVPLQSTRLDVSCGPFMETATVDLTDFDGEPILIQMQRRCGMPALQLEQAVTCSDCHRMPG